jgi:hypothetical protein
LRENDGLPEVNDDENEMRVPVKFHKFREDAKKYIKEMTHQNHDFMKVTQIITKSILDVSRFKPYFDDN